MKNQIVRIMTVLAMAVLWLAGAAQAQIAQHRVKVNVPFEFSVNNKLYPAGEYVLLCTPGQIEMRDAQAHVVASMISHSVESLSESVSPKLIFTAAGSSLTLSQVWVGNTNYGYELSRSKAEIALARQRGNVSNPDHAGGK